MESKQIVRLTKALLSARSDKILASASHPLPNNWESYTLRCMLGDLSDIETDDCVVLVKLDTPEVLAMVVDEKWYNQTVLGEEMKLFSLELTFDHETEAEKKVEKKVGYLRIVFDGKVQLAHIAIHADINAPPTDE